MRFCQEPCEEAETVGVRFSASRKPYTYGLGFLARFLTKSLGVPLGGIPPGTNPRSSMQPQTGSSTQLQAGSSTQLGAGPSRQRVDLDNHECSWQIHDGSPTVTGWVAERRFETAFTHEGLPTAFVVTKRTPQRGWRRHRYIIRMICFSTCNNMQRIVTNRSFVMIRCMTIRGDYHWRRIESDNMSETGGLLPPSIQYRSRSLDTIILQSTQCCWMRWYRTLRRRSNPQWLIWRGTWCPVEIDLSRNDWDCLRLSGRLETTPAEKWD